MAQTLVDTDVLIVGAGPTGLSAACKLARQGVDFRIVEKLEKASDRSKALVVHSRTLELLKSIGCVEKFLEFGTKLGGMNIYDEGKRIAHISLTHVDSPYQFALSIPQYDTEKLLYDQMRASSKVDVERQKELFKLEQQDDCVVASVRKADGTEEHIKARYVIASDGAHSTGRKQINEQFVGGEYADGFMLADVLVDWNGHKTEGELHAFSGAGGTVAFFPMLNGYWRVLLVVLPDEAPEGTEPTLEDVQDRVNKICPWGLKLTQPVWLANFKVRYRKVDHYRNNRVFLAGDAAHIHSPVGGQGMNTGMHDAFNLSWKIALAVKGFASEALLDSYHSERHAVAEQLLKMVDLMTRVNLLRAPVARKLRNAIAPLIIQQEPIQQRMGSFISQVAVNYRHSPVVRESRRSLVSATVAAKSDVEPQLNEWLDFAHGPQPGDRAPDCQITDLKNGNITDVLTLMRTGKHVLLLLTGDKPSDNEYKELAELGKKAVAAYGPLLDAHLISSEKTIPEGVGWSGNAYTDPDFTLEERYGAGSSCVYLIRPDGYIGFRGQPVNFDGLKEYFDKICRTK